MQANSFRPRIDLIICQLLVSVVLIASPPTTSASIIVSADAKGSTSPPLGFYPDVVENGDFRIFRSSNPNSFEDFIIGDGSDEHTSWLFDFTSDPDFLLLDSKRPFLEVTLSITLTAGFRGVSLGNDRVAIFGLGQSQAPRGFQLDPFETDTFHIDLTSFSSQYNAETIRQRFRSDDIPADPRLFEAYFGQLSMTYADDAIVSNTTMTIKGHQIPEPASCMIWGVLGSAGWFLRRRIVRLLPSAQTSGPLA